MRDDGAGSGNPGDGDGSFDLTISAIFRGDFVREIEGHDYEAGRGTLAVSVEGCVRSLCPGASVSVWPADLLDGDWEVQVGEPGHGPMDGAGRGSIERYRRSAAAESTSRFRGQAR